MFKVVIHIALRNLIANKVTSFIIGGIIFFGTFLVILGSSLVNTINSGMTNSITQSVAGHLQIYGADSKDKLALFGGGFMGSQDLDEIDDFTKIRQLLEPLAEVKAVVPMGLQLTSVSAGGNEIDQTLTAMRDAIQQNDQQTLVGLISRFQKIINDLIKNTNNQLNIASNKQKFEQQLFDLKKVSSEQFWQQFSENPLSQMDFLDNKIAPLSEANKLMYFRNLGTDMDRFTELFKNFEIISGKPIPKGKKGYLISSRLYEKRLKNRVAREFDKINKQLNKQGKHIDDTPKLREIIRRLPAQYRQISYQLSPKDSQWLTAKLQTLLSSSDPDLGQLLRSFLTLDEQNFNQRYHFFYANIAPKIPLYWFNIGDDITLRAVTKAGYYKSMNVHLYGIYRFKGLEDSDLAGALNLMDMVSFRELYGVMTEDMQQELSLIRQQANITALSADNAEDSLFGESSELLESADNESFFANNDSLVVQAESSNFIQPEEIEQGFVLNAAIILHHSHQLQPAKQKISALFEQHDLNLQLSDWQEASGIIGQFMVVINVVLYTAILIVFLVAMVIINNSMIMATSERIAEIGAMRAIGAQRHFILALFLSETFVLGVLSATLGILVSGSLLSYLASTGIPANSDVMEFLFSGPQLYPQTSFTEQIYGAMSVLLMVLISTFYPAHLATRVEPIVAMQGHE
jgi:ABC-type lipoprotein release transport system permease subunit